MGDAKHGWQCSRTAKRLSRLLILLSRMPTRPSTYALVELIVRGKTFGCQGALPAARRCTELRDQIFTVETAAPKVGHARTARVRRANAHHLAPLSARVARASLALQRLSAHAHRSQPIEASRPHRLAASRRRGRPSHTLPPAGEFGNASNMSGVRCKGSNPLSVCCEPVRALTAALSRAAGRARAILPSRCPSRARSAGALRCAHARGGLEGCGGRVGGP